MGVRPYVHWRDQFPEIPSRRSWRAEFSTKKPDPALLLPEGHAGTADIEPCLGHGSDELDTLPGGVEGTALHKKNRPNPAVAKGSCWHSRH